MEQVIYTKYSNGRAPQFAIRTSIVQRENGECVIYKIAEFPQGEAHIHHIREAAEALEKCWEDTGFQVNQCVLEEDRVRLQFLKGHTLEEELDILLDSGQSEAAKKRILEVLESIQKTARNRFEMTPEFEAVFGKQQISAEEYALSPADIDMIFSNMFLEGGKLHVIDYEWTFFFPVPVKFVLYRALHYYFESASKRRNLKESCNFYEQMGITEAQQEMYGNMEKNFQSYIQGGYVSTGELYHTMGQPAVALSDVMNDRRKCSMQVYLDKGNGFCEADSYLIDRQYKQEVIECIKIPAGTAAVRIDPAFGDCILEGLQLVWGSGREVHYRSSGYTCRKNCLVFGDSDPKIEILRIPAEEKEIRVSYRISMLEHTTAELLANRKTVTRIKEKVRKCIRG